MSLTHYLLSYQIYKYTHFRTFIHHLHAGGVNSKSFLYDLCRLTEHSRTEEIIDPQDLISKTLEENSTSLANIRTHMNLYHKTIHVFFRFP